MGSTVNTVVLNWETNKTPAKLTLDGEDIDKSLKTKTIESAAIKANKTYTLKLQMRETQKQQRQQQSHSLMAFTGVLEMINQASTALLSLDSPKACKQTKQKHLPSMRQLVNTFITLSQHGTVHRLLKLAVLKAVLLKQQQSILQMRLDMKNHTTSGNPIMPVWEIQQL